ncbi:hypothetical protein CVT24_005711, partial [Panaeolus cyanescens]
MWRDICDLIREIDPTSANAAVISLQEAKCMQRKTRCTFVKFHRQTAPVGPGHNPQSNSVGGMGSALGMPPPLHASASTSSSLSASGLAGPSGLGGNPLGTNALLDLDLDHAHGGHRMPPLFSTHALDRRTFDDDFMLGQQGQAPPPPPTAVSSMAEALGYGGAPGFGFPGGLYGTSAQSQGQQAPPPPLSSHQQQSQGMHHTPSPEHFGGGTS